MGGWKRGAWVYEGWPLLYFTHLFISHRSNDYVFLNSVYGPKTGIDPMKLGFDLKTNFFDLVSVLLQRSFCFKSAHVVKQDRIPYKLKEMYLRFHIYLGLK